VVHAGCAGNDVVCQLKKIYDQNPLESIQAQNLNKILGVQVQLWSEYIPDSSIAEYQLYPRACALAETAWSPAKKKHWHRFEFNLALHLKRLDYLGIAYRAPKAYDNDPYMNSQ
jgi:hexosaminidase